MSLLARRYATALFAAAQERGESAAVLADLEKLQVAFTDPETASALRDPSMPRPRLLATLDKLLGDGSELSRNLVQVVLRRRREAILPDLYGEFAAMVREAAGEVRAQIRSARRLDLGEVEAIRHELARLTGKTVLSEVEIDPELLAGVRVRVGNTLYDGSLLGELLALQQHLLQAPAR